MHRNVAIVLTVFAIGYFGALIVTSGGLNGDSSPEISGTNYIVELQDGIVILDSVTVEAPHRLIGTIQFSEDGSACWEVTEKIGALYYKLLEECPEYIPTIEAPVQHAETNTGITIDWTCKLLEECA